jgi:multiple sugar transport system substrate-binding protein
MVCIILLTFVLSGCVGATPTLEPATIVLAHIDSDEGFFATAAQQFTQLHPTITVEVLPLDPDRLAEYAADQVDVREVWQVVVGTLQEEGNLLELGPFIEADDMYDSSDFYPAAWEAFTIDDRVWAIPSGANPLVLFYNKDLFDQNEIPYPENGWTWDEMLNAALAIRDSDAGIFGYIEDNVGPYGSMTFVYQHGGRLFDDLGNPTRTTFDDPLTIEAMEWYGALYIEHNVAPTQQQAMRSFTNGRYAILGSQIGMWLTEYFAQGGGTWPNLDWDDIRWGMVTLPQDVQAATGGMCGGYAISSETDHPEAAWQLVAFLSTQLRDRVVPVRMSLIESPEYTRRIDADEGELVRECMESGLYFSPSIYTRFEGAMEIFEEAVEMITSGQSTAQAAMTWAQEEAEGRGP